MSPLPLPLATWAEGALRRDLGDEPLSPCDACPVAGVTVPADVKCCGAPTEVPNFLVGAVLDRPSVLARLTARRGVTPLGLGRFTGDDTAGACAHLLRDTGACGIHLARPAACATFFCRHERRGLGARSWRGVGELLTVAQGRVALWCAREAGLPLGALRALMAPSGQRPPDRDVSDAAWAARWGPFAGDVAGFFRACAERAAPLAWEDVARITGVEGEVLAASASAAAHALDDHAVPARLAVGEHVVVGVGADSLRVVTTSRHQPLDVSALVHSVLTYFDGRPTGDARAVMAEERGVSLDDALLRQLIDAGLLVAVG